MRRAACAFLLFFAACSKCGKDAGAVSGGVERVLPRGSAIVLVVPDVQALGASWATAATWARSRPSGAPRRVGLSRRWRGSSSVVRRQRVINMSQKCLKRLMVKRK